LKTIYFVILGLPVNPISNAIVEIEAAMLLVERTAIVTHDHPEAVCRVQATIMAIWLAL
jgi:hypothetical protein